MNSSGSLESELFSAVNQGEIKNVNLLIQATKVNINAQDQNGSTPLHSAIVRGYTEIVKLLLDANADVNIKDKDGWTPLHQAVIRRDSETVRLLLAANADVNIQDKRNRVPLHFAIAYGYTQIVKMLLEVTTVNVNIQDEYGSTSLDRAVKKGDCEVIRLLLFAKAANPFLCSTSSVFTEQAKNYYLKKNKSWDQLSKFFFLLENIKKESKDEKAIRDSFYNQYLFDRNVISIIFDYIPETSCDDSSRIKLIYDDLVNNILGKIYLFIPKENTISEKIENLKKLDINHFKFSNNSFEMDVFYFVKNELVEKWENEMDAQIQFQEIKASEPLFISQQNDNKKRKINSNLSIFSGTHNDASGNEVFDTSRQENISIYK